MGFATEPLFRDDAYVREFSAKVLGVNGRGGIILDQTAFYAAGGGQPGDTGQLRRADGTAIKIGATIYGEGKAEIVHVPMSGDTLPEPGETMVGAIDWPRRNLHMRMHTALHLLCSLVPFAVTGGSIKDTDSRLDFDIEDAGAIDKDTLTDQLMALVAKDYLVTARWITDAELAANPDLVRTMSAKPPMGSGRVRLIAIGDDGGIDLQPCGGTHVRSTAEIGALKVTKIEKKGRQNRRIRIRLDNDK